MASLAYDEDDQNTDELDQEDKNVQQKDTAICDPRGDCEAVP